LHSKALLSERAVTIVPERVTFDFFIMILTLSHYFSQSYSDIFYEFFIISVAILSRGKTISAAPISIASLGIPNTIELFSS
jgi:hypothetical protein